MNLNEKVAGRCCPHELATNQHKLKLIFSGIKFTGN